MIRWLGLLALGLAAVTTWAAPDPASIDLRRPAIAVYDGRLADDASPRVRMNHLDTRLATLAARLHAIDELDEWVPSLLQHHAREGGLWIRGTPGVPQITLRSIHEAFAKLTPDADVAVGMVAVPGAGLSEVTRPRQAVGRAEDGTAWCIRIVSVPSNPEEAGVAWPVPTPTDELYAANPFGVCAWVARHGLPGTEVTRWLEDSGRGLLGYLGGPAIHPLFRRSIVQESPRFLHDRPSVEARACAAGELDYCESLLFPPRDILSGRRAAQRHGGLAELYLDEATFRSQRWLGQVVRGVFPELHADFGADAFGEFWRSDAPVPEAFEAAFGVTPGEWLQGELLGPERVARSGPAPRGIEWIAVMAWALLFLGIATRTVKRRRAA